MHNIDLVSILIVTWNSAAYLPRCLSSLEKQSYKNFEIIVIDNGSLDDSVAIVEEQYSELDIRIKKLSVNKGFAVANNIGARLARGQWLALLNADAFPEEDWLKNLVEAAKKHPNAFFSSRQIQVNSPGMLDGEGDEYHVSGLAWRRNYNAPIYPSAEIEEVFSSCAAAALYPLQVFLAVDGFDEDYFSYFEDVDLGFRLRLYGLHAYYVPQAVVHHIGSASTGKVSDFAVYHGHRNMVWTYLKNMPSYLFWLYLPFHLLVNLFFLWRFSMRGMGRVVWQAKFDALNKIILMIQKRRNVQSNRIASISDIYRAINKMNFIELKQTLNKHSTQKKS